MEKSKVNTQEEWTFTYDGARRGWMIQCGIKLIALIPDEPPQTDWETFAYRQAKSIVENANASTQIPCADEDLR